MNIVYNFALIIIVGLFLISPSEIDASKAFLIGPVEFTDEEKVTHSRDIYQRYTQHALCPSTGYTMGRVENRFSIP